MNCDTFLEFPVASEEIAVDCLSNLDNLEIESETIGTSQKQYYCKYCDFKTLSLRSLKEHKARIAHKEVDERPCPICAKMINVTTFRLHVRRSHMESSVSCKICNQKMKNNQSLRSHLKVKHQETESDKIYKCKTCEFTSYLYKNYKSHLKAHRKVEQSICNYCGMQIRKDNLGKHIASQHKAPSVICEICGKQLKNAVVLKGHMLMHEDGQLQCEKCGKVYKYRQGYSSHMKCHAEGQVKNVECLVCGKPFSSKKLLPKHLRTHTGEKPYSCEDCGRKFISSYDLKSHSKQHTQEKPFSCVLCDLVFAHKSSLKTHLNSKH